MGPLHFRRVGAIAAFCVAVSTLLYGLVFLLLVPAAQRPGAPVAGFYDSFLANPGPGQTLDALLVFGGIFVSVGAAAVYEKLAIHGGWARWGTTLGIAVGVLTALHGLWSATSTPIIAGLYAAGDAPTRTSLGIMSALPSPMDPKGFATFGLAGLWTLATAGLILRTAEFPRFLGYVGLLTGALLMAVFAGSLIDNTPLRGAFGLIVALVASPIWWAWLGYDLWNSDPNAAPQPTLPGIPIPNLRQPAPAQPRRTPKRR